MKTGLAALAGLAATSVVANAADLPSRAPPPPYIAPIISGWDGFYAGTTYGYGSTHFRTTQFATDKRSVDGSTGGGIIGYNFQTGHFVYGIEGGIDINTIDGNLRGKLGLIPTHVDSLYDARLRGRLGYEFGWFMPFVAGGVAFSETNQSDHTPGLQFGDNKTSTGYTVGAGVDFKLNLARTFGLNSYLINEFLGPLIVRVEYLHDGKGKETYQFEGNTFRTSSDSDIVRVALISRFGETAARPYMDSTGLVNWSGAYGGVFGSYGSFTPETKGLGTKTHFTADGPQGGIYTGTNLIFRNNFMIGIEGTTAYADISGNGAEPSGTAHYRNMINADGRVRAGYAFGRFLPFVAGGITYGVSEQRDLATGSQRGNLTNIAAEVGAGLDYRLTEHVSVRGEYIHDIGLNDKLVNLNNCLCRQKIDGDLFRLGAAYHFE